MVVPRNLFLLQGGQKLLLFLTRESEILSVVSWGLSIFSEWKNPINCNIGVKSWISLFISIVLGFLVEIILSPVFNKLVCLSVNTF